MKRVLRLAVVVGVVLGLTMMPTSPATAAGGGAGRVHGAGYVSPGFTTSPTGGIHYTFGYEKPVLADSGTSPSVLLDLSCDLELDSSIWETTVEGQGRGTERCTDRTYSAGDPPWLLVGYPRMTCSVEYWRAGLYMELQGFCELSVTRQDTTTTTSTTESMHIQMTPATTLLAATTQYTLEGAWATAGT